MPPKPIYCDLDNVLVDFVTPSLSIHGRQDLIDDPSFPPIFYYWECENFLMTPDEFWKPIKEAGPNWWRDLPLLPWARELMDLLNAANPKWEIATACSSGESACGKWHWRDINAKGHKLHITEDKLAFARKGALLIDDADANVEGWRRLHGDAILLPRSWNRLSCVDDVIGYVRHEMEVLGYAPQAD